MFERCLQQVEEAASEDVAAQVRYATFLSYALTDAGDYDRAADVVREALNSAVDHTDPYTRVRLYWSLARLSGMAGRSGEALEYIRSAIALLKATDDGLRWRGRICSRAGIETDAAPRRCHVEHLDLAERLLGPTPDPVDVGILRIGQSRIAALRATRRRPSNEHVTHSPSSATSTAASREPLSMHWRRGLALQGDDNGAEDAYRRAVDLLTVHGRRADAGAAALEWANFLSERGREKEAEPILRRAYDLGVDAETAATKS